MDDVTPEVQLLDIEGIARALMYRDRHYATEAFTRAVLRMLHTDEAAFKNAWDAHQDYLDRVRADRRNGARSVLGLGARKLADIAVARGVSAAAVNFLASIHLKGQPWTLPKE